jgi:hypothetical protein
MKLVTTVALAALRGPVPLAKAPATCRCASRRVWRSRYPGAQRGTPGAGAPGPGWAAARCP